MNSSELRLGISIEELRLGISIEELRERMTDEERAKVQVVHAALVSVLQNWTLDPAMEAWINAQIERCGLLLEEVAH